MLHLLIWFLLLSPIVVIAIEEILIGSMYYFPLYIKPVELYLQIPTKSGIIRQPTLRLLVHSRP